MLSGFFDGTASPRRVLATYGEREWLLSAVASQAPLFASQKGG